jgi:hypothetical protein
VAAVFAKITGKKCEKIVVEKSFAPSNGAGLGADSRPFSRRASRNETSRRRHLRFVRYCGELNRGWGRGETSPILPYTDATGSTMAGTTPTALIGAVASGAATTLLASAGAGDGAGLVGGAAAVCVGAVAGGGSGAGVPPGFAAATAGSW